MKELFKSKMQFLKRWPWPALLSLVIILMAILAVAWADQLENRLALRIDLSFNRVTSQSEQSKQVLQELIHPVHAYVISSPGMENQDLLGLLNRFSAINPRFSYSTENLVNNPMLVNLLSSSLEDQGVGSDSLLIHSETTKRTRVLSLADFLEQSFDMDSQSFVLSGLRYEKAVIEAILYVTMDELPTVYLLDGHGEIPPELTAHMEGLLATYHYQVLRIDLTKTSFLKSDGLLMILAPQIDLIQAELDIINGFLREGGALLAVSIYSDPDELPLLDALYRQLGFIRKPGIVVAEIEDHAAYIDSPVFLTPYLQNTQASASMIAAGQTRLRMPGARAFEGISQSRSLQVEPLILSGMAYIKPIERANLSLLQEEGEEEGRFALGLLSTLIHTDGQLSKAAILGNAAMFLDQFLQESSYGDQLLLHLVDYLIPRKAISLDISPKKLVRESLNIGNPLLPQLAIVLLPLLALLIGIPVLLNRRRKR